MDASAIAENYLACRARLDRASGRPGAVEICAVTKTVDPAAINAAYDAGARLIGENRVQELTEKFPALNDGFSVHLIGQLQTNKVKYIMSCVSMVESLDRMALANELHRRAQMANRAMPVLVQVNIAREPQKAGLSEDEVLPFLRECAKLKGIKIEGLMAVMPLVPDPEEIRPLFRRMRVLFENMRAEAVDGVSMNRLSMGMSQDYWVAAEEGATMVRLGSAIFGKRVSVC